MTIGALMTKTEIKIKKGKKRPKLIVSREKWKRVNPKDRETLKVLYKIIHRPLSKKGDKDFQVIYNEKNGRKTKEN